MFQQMVGDQFQDKASRFGQFPKSVFTFFIVKQMTQLFSIILLLLTRFNKIALIKIVRVLFRPDPSFEFTSCTSEEDNPGLPLVIRGVSSPFISYGQRFNFQDIDARFFPSIFKLMRFSNIRMAEMFRPGGSSYFQTEFVKHSENIRITPSLTLGESDTARCAWLADLNRVPDQLHALLVLPV